MANLKDIRRRIVSVKSTRQITRAMKLVAAAKLRRAQDAILAARPYAYRIYSILLSLTEGDAAKHPLLVQREEKKIKLVVLAGDRGLCGPFNANIFKASEKFIKAKQASGVEVQVACIGKKAYEYFKDHGESPVYHTGLLSDPSFSRVAKIADELLESFAGEHFDAAYLVYNEFKSAIQQTVVVERLIPIGLELPEGVVGIRQLSKKDTFIDPIFEPSRQEILDVLVPRHFKTQLFRSVLESIASEHGSRMSAMESATKNASEMIDKLTLDYNKARQAGITKELMEIVGGVEAMK
ncbi:MAG: ATP synthase F1 subunit gamma [Bdellovibrionaceae bacterium]|nr:ATP synthase F1 subunit gamma [Pseudobdellovibrionaceae bacterium]